jgi:very-short-patch-repair endonuclease
MLRLRQVEGYRFRRQVQIERFTAGFVCYEAKLIAEIDGRQHNPSSGREANRTRFLQSEGYRVLRSRNNQVLSNPEGTRIMIAENLRRAHPHPDPPPSRGRAAGFRD